MARAPDDKLELVQGTLDMLILKTLAFGPAHGHGIATQIRQSSRDVLTVEHGSLYPALHRLVRRRLITARWERPPGAAREYKYYRLTPAGRRALARQESRWNRLVLAIANVLQPAPEA